MSDFRFARPDKWRGAEVISPLSYQCGYCGNQVASTIGYWTGDHRNGSIMICPLCNFPTIFLLRKGTLSSSQIPNSMPGSGVPSVPESLASLYDEARTCVSAGAFTASVLICRKMLIDLAVAQGDKYAKGKRFFEYVEFLATTVFAPPHGRDWLERIKDQGNKATHELGMMTEDDAILLIKFLEMLLRMLYEFPALLVSQDAPTASQSSSPGNHFNPRPSGSADGGAGTVNH